MTDLTDAQRAVLAPAAVRDDRCIYPITAPLKGGAVGNVAKSLIKRGLVEETPAGDAHTVWRCDDDGRGLTLRITDAGLRAIGGGVVDAREQEESGVEPAVVADDVRPRNRGAAQGALLALLRRVEGATIAELQQATGWQPHSVRGALSGIVRKKLGHDVVSAKEAERGRVYRIAD